MGNAISRVAGGFKNEIMSALNSMAPYSSESMVEMIRADNPKYESFYTKGTRRDEILLNHSVSQGNPTGRHPMGSFTAPSDYHSFMYANVEPDKLKRLNEYRSMSGYDFINNALDEICDEFIVKDDKDEIIKIKVDDDIDPTSRETIIDEFNKFVRYFELENKGWEYIRTFLVDGEIYFENIVHKDHPKKGIVGVVSIPSESVDPIYNNVQNLLVRGYLLRKPVYDVDTKEVKEIIPVILDKNQVTYFHSGEWDTQKNFRISHIEKATKAYKQLNMIEDSIVIHRLVNAPEKLVFKVDVGNMSSVQSERYIQQLAQKYWSKKTYDNKQGGVNMFNPQSMLDAFWFPKRAGSEGTEVTKLQNAGASLGDLPDLDFFSKKLYKALSVPSNRLASDSGYSDGTDMLREELKFARFIIRLQTRFSEVIKDSFLTHLKFRGWYDEYNIKPSKIKIKMNEPTHFNVLREQQIFEIRSNNYAAMASSELISETYSQKLYLGWDDTTILANKEHLRKEQAFKWELESIAAYGPKWRTAMDNDTEAAGGSLDGGGGSGLGGDDFGGGDFGDDGGDIEVDGNAPMETGPISGNDAGMEGDVE